jgi:large subunit ribosomal protein L21
MTRAIIETGGKQYHVSSGQTITIEKLTAEVGSVVHFDRVLMLATDADVRLGAPYLTGETVSGEVIAQTKGKKIRVATYKSKKRQRRVLGHRQLVTKVCIGAIGTAAPATAATDAQPKAVKPKAAPKKAAPKQK